MTILPTQGFPRSVALIMPCVLMGCMLNSVSATQAASNTADTKTAEKKLGKKITLEKKLSAIQYKVTQEQGTEPPFQNAFWNEKRAGIYVDLISGEALFSSKHKFKSGTGWPSFTEPLEPKNISTHTDISLGMTRVEIRSVKGDAHLGHLFKDGPKPTGLRYCINSAALRFIPQEDFEKEGYNEYSQEFGAQDKTATQRATLAGGCFWGVEELIRTLPGVISTEVGYTGGTFSTPRYEDVSQGDTGHAESVHVVFDPRKLSYKVLLEYFFRLHDPTTLNQQGNDKGSQYRSAIFYHSAEQERIAQEVKTAVNVSGKWKSAVVTQIIPASVFTKAEDYHQDYLLKNPSGYTCHFLRD